MQHELKSLPPFFKAIIDGTKTFEVRLNDRSFKPGDVINLREFTGTNYTGREQWVDVTHVSDYEQQNGYVVLAIKLRPQTVVPAAGYPPEEPPR
jgi:ASC-1-like (ASCH) protein